MAGATELQTMYNWFEEYMNAYLGGLTGQPYLESWETVGLEDLFSAMQTAYEPTLENLMDQYYNTAAVMGQAVPGQGFSGAAKGGLENVLADYGAAIMGDVLNAYMMPYTSMFAGLGGTGTQLAGLSTEQDIAELQAQTAGMGQITQGFMGPDISCCFIFLEADNGLLDRIARRYRDEYGTAQQRIGYKVLSLSLVPMMKKSKIIKFLVKWLMVRPMIWAGRAFYGENKWGNIFHYYAKGWMKIFETMGEKVTRTFFIRLKKEMVKNAAQN